MPHSRVSLLSPFRHLKHRPALLWAGLAGAVIGWGADKFFDPVSAVLFGWCGAVIVYLAVAVRAASHASTTDIRQRAARLDEGGLAILIVTVGAALASVGAIVFNLAQAKGSPHAGLAAALAAVTVILSWMFVHVIFAFHYAHEYYLLEDPSKAPALDFPDTKTPSYWDFFYFSYVVGMTAQVADVAIQSPSMRKLVLVHSLIAFLFNTAILALGVNLAASLVS